MSFRHSHMLLAAMAMIAAPSFAQEVKDAAANTQESAAEATVPESVVNEVKQAAEETAGAAGEAASGTADAKEETMPAGAETEAAAGTDAPAASEEPAPEAAQAPAEQPPADLAAASADAAELGQPYIQAVHQDWDIRCIKTGQEADPCVLNQLLLDEADNPVVEVNFIPLLGMDAAAGGTFITPLETDLVVGLGISIDKGPTTGYPFSVCTARDGCVVRVGLTPQELSKFKRGSQAIVSLLPYAADPKNPIQLPMSLSGFTAGFEELTKMANDAQAAATGGSAQEEAPAE